jgi:hypothetical protein
VIFIPAKKMDRKILCELLTRLHLTDVANKTSVRAPLKKKLASQTYIMPPVKMSIGVRGGPASKQIAVCL